MKINLFYFKFFEKKLTKKKKKKAELEEGEHVLGSWRNYQTNFRLHFPQETNPPLLRFFFFFFFLILKIFFVNKKKVEYSVKVFLSRKGREEPMKGKSNFFVFEKIDFLLPNPVKSIKSEFGDVGQIFFKALLDNSIYSPGFFFFFFFFSLFF